MIPEEIPKVLRKDYSLIPLIFQQYSVSSHYTHALLRLRLLRLSFSLKQAIKKSEHDNLGVIEGKFQEVVRRQRLPGNLLGCLIITKNFGKIC